jgi:hypothetical protein
VGKLPVGAGAGNAGAPMMESLEGRLRELFMGKPGSAGCRSVTRRMGRCVLWRFVFFYTDESKSMLI